MTPEGKVVQAVKTAVLKAGGFVRKIVYVGRGGAPDLLVCLGGRHCFVECKAPGQKPRANQLREHQRLSEIGGCSVYVIDNVRDAEEIVTLLQCYE